MGDSAEHEAEAARRARLDDKIDDKVGELLGDPEFRPKWTNRRRVIFLSLGICGLLFLAINTVALYRMYRVSRGEEVGAMDPGFTGLLQTLIWANVAFSSSIVFAYVFGASVDAKDFRKQLTGLIGNGRGKR